MRKDVFILFLFLFIVPAFGGNPDYEFELVWKVPSCLPLGIYVVDLDNDGLSEILYTCDDTQGYTVTAVDTFSNFLWQVPLGDYLSILFEDVEGDGLKEIFMVTQVTSYSEEMDTHRGKRQITCFNSKGSLLWSKILEINTEWDGYSFNRYKIILADVNKDGYNEIMVANLILDRKGDILYEYGDDYSIIGCIQDSETRLIMEKEADPSFVGFENYAAYCRIITLEGDIIWEKEFSNQTYFCFLENENEKRLFFVQVNTVTEIDVTTCEEKPRIAFDFDHISDKVLLEFYILDVDDNGQHEYVIIAYDDNALGYSALYVYDSEFGLIWKYVDPKFVVDVVDMDNNGRCEFLIYYRVWLNSDSVPTFFRVLNYDNSERWTVLLDDLFYYYIVDIDADGDTEVIFRVKLPPETFLQDTNPEEALSKDLFVERDHSEYLYVFSPEGAIEKQIKVPFGGFLIHDVDGDGDVDMLRRAVGDEVGLCVYTNTRFTGALDALPGLGTLEEVDVGEEGFQRDYWLNPAGYYGYQRLTYFLKHPRHVPLLYRGKLTIFFSVGAVLGVVFSLFVVRTLKNGNKWEPLWGWKRAFAYVLLLPVSPVGLVYLGYTVIRSGEDYKKALGFIRITKRQFLVSLAVGVILLLFYWMVASLLAMSGLTFPETGLLERIADLAIVGVLIVITALFVEEILFSGYFYPLLRNRLGIRLGIVLISFLFAVLHLELVLIPLFFLGAVMKTYAYERTHCLYVPMIIYFVSIVAVASGLL
ncbi:MAG: CPBP family intramembrane metalloprotease [Theionarchaea archaeon]|nr:MAG: hypothetical protein AYK19_01520 [Theionarchaea archaeon DG-70-1]MBU7025766.1 CPBP family intramembrane metalloprotease [Theionarchaea archaeon]